MRQLLALIFCLTVLPVQAEYVIAPDIAKEYVDLQARGRKHPNNVDLNFEYAICLSYVGKVEEGKAALKKVRNRDPGFPEKALPRYLKEYQNDPANPKIKYRLGFLYYFNDKYEEALRVLAEVADERPVGQLNAWALGYMAVIKGEQKKWQEGERLVRQALQIEPDAYALRAALAAALKEQGKLWAATKEFFRALRNRSEFDEYEKTLFQQP